MNKELKEQAHKEFDDKFSETILVDDDLWKYGGTICKRDEKTYIFNVNEIKSFIDSLIDKTVQMTEEGIVEKIDELIKKTKDYKEKSGLYEARDVITNKSDINN